MKYVFLLMATALVSGAAIAQNDTKKPPASPPATVMQTVASGATITINYSRPSVRGRKIGADLEPKAGEVWRTGANKATTFEVSQDVKINGKALPKGKYSLFTLADGNNWTLIFNKTWDQWGAYKYSQADDALRVDANGSEGEFSEQLTFSVAQNGKVNLAWGGHQVSFMVE